MITNAYRVLRHSVLGLLVAALLVSTPACTDEEFAIGLGAVAIGVGVVAIGVGLSDDDDDHHHHRPPRCHGGYVTRCTEYRDYRGRWRQECREVWDSCADYYSADGVIQAMSPAAAQHGGEHPLAVSLARTLNMSFDAANFLLTALQEGQAGNIKAVEALGLTRTDMIRLAQFEGLEEASVDRVAQALDLSKDTVTGVIARITSETRLQASSIESPYWKSCMAGGRWKTDRNLNCQHTWWEGCSPASGANFCRAQ